MVKLGQGQVLNKAPGFASVAADVESAVVAFNHIARRGGRQPKGVVVGVNVAVGRNSLPAAAAVFRLGYERPQGVDGVLAKGVHINFAVVERTVANVVGVADAGPLYAPVVAAVQGIFFFVLDQSIDHVGVARGNGQADSAELAFGQAVFGGALGPGFARVMAHEEARAVAAALKEPGPAAVFPHGGKKLVGVDRVDHEVGRATAVVAVEHLAPGLASVGGFVDAPVFGVAIGKANCSD